MAKTILCPTDFSAGANGALYYASLLARTLDCELLIVHVKPGNVLPRADEDVDDPEEPHIHQMLQETVPQDSAVSVRHQFLRGNPRDEILNLAESEDVALIALGTHGQTNSPDVAMGAIAEAVVRDAKHPVLAVKPNSGG